MAKYSVTFDQTVELRYMVRLEDESLHTGDDAVRGYYNSLGYAKSAAWRLAERRRQNVVIEVQAFRTDTGEPLDSGRCIGKVAR